MKSRRDNNKKKIELIVYHLGYKPKNKIKNLLKPENIFKMKINLLGYKQDA